MVALTADLTRPGAAETLMSQARESLGGLRGVAITTGLGMHGQRDLLSGSDEDWLATFDDVLLATVRPGRAAVPVLIEEGGGAIATTAAYSIRAPKAHQFPYATLKAGVATLTKNVAKSFGHLECEPTAFAQARPRPRYSPPCGPASPSRAVGLTTRHSSA